MMPHITLIVRDYDKELVIQVARLGLTLVEEYFRPEQPSCR